MKTMARWQPRWRYTKRKSRDHCPPRPSERRIQFSSISPATFSVKGSVNAELQFYLPRDLHEDGKHR